MCTENFLTHLNLSNENKKINQFQIWEPIIPTFLNSLTFYSIVTIIVAIIWLKLKIFVASWT